MGTGAAMTGDMLYLHIGLPKTASTFLQEEIFPQLPAVRYLGSPISRFFSTPEDLRERQRVLANCVKRSTLIWDQLGDRVFIELFGCTAPERQPGSVLFSEEAVGRAGSRPTFLREHLKGLTAQARAWGFSGVKIVCAFRRQDDWIASHYAQISDRNAEASQRDFEENVRAKLDPGRSRFTIGMLLDYSVLARELEAAVGRGNYLMRPYELLVEDENTFLRQLESFIGGQPLLDSTASVEARPRQNVRSEAPGVWQLRRFPRVRRIHLRPSRLFSAIGLPTEVHLIGGGRGGTGRIRLSDEMRADVLGAYEPSNRELARRLGVDLSRFGYYEAA